MAGSNTSEPELLLDPQLQAFHVLCLLLEQEPPHLPPPTVHPSLRALTEPCLQVGLL